MSTSEPNKDEAPASETTAAPSEPESEPEKTAAKPDDSGDAPAADQPAADQPAAAQARGEPADEPAAKTETAPAAQPDAAEEKALAEEPVWPPPESQPVAPEGGKDEGAEPALLTKPDEPKPAAEAKAPDAQASDAQATEAQATEAQATEARSTEAQWTEGASPKGKSSEDPSPDAPPAAEAAAAEPGQEMTLSESTLHWLVDGEVPIEPTGPNPTLAPIYDSHAPVAGRKRTVAVIGGAAVLALAVALVLHAQAAHDEKPAAVAPSVGSADLLIHRAEAALAKGRSAEALDLARLATVTDPHYADAYVVIGGIQKSNGQAIDARDAYRRYLDLAPLGGHAAEARAALKTLPP
jgi:tetratricopeptide (TPR) repeat protein